MPETEQQIFHLRRALSNPAFAELHPIHCAQILTNLANQLDLVGRFVEARALWTLALADFPTFWMARGNRGRSLLTAFRTLYDHDQRATFVVTARRELLQAIKDLDEHPELGDANVRAYFAEKADEATAFGDMDRLAAHYRPDDGDLGETEAERAYRHWALRNTLFLNPYNDLGPDWIAARDMLLLPAFRTAFDEAPVLLGFFNQLKQEYATARWLCYEGVSPSDMHFSDRGVSLYNTLDYPALGINVEKLKLSFRMSYSLFDKIGYFLNRYLKLGIPERQVNFRSIWREKSGALIRPQWEASQNWAFRGLFWLSRDLFDRTFTDTIEPDGRALDALRNHLEHKYVKVVSTNRVAAPSGGGPDPMFDDFAYVMTRADLEAKALALLRQTRAALLYLCLGMNIEERRRRKAAPPDEVTIRAPVDLWDDEWKGISDGRVDTQPTMRRQPRTRDRPAVGLGEPGSSPPTAASKAGSALRYLFSCRSHDHKCLVGRDKPVGRLEDDLVLALVGKCRDHRQLAHSGHVGRDRNRTGGHGICHVGDLDRAAERTVDAQAEHNLG